MDMTPITHGLLEVLLRSGKVFRGASPFPHIVLEGLFPDKLTRRAAREAYTLYADEPARWHVFATGKNVDHKRQLSDVTPMGKNVRQLLYLFQSAPVVHALGVMAKRTLVADPGLMGGGLHAIESGGYLNVHVDFNWHPVLQARRRLNVLVYLNEDWDPAWGGDLELWEAEPGAQPHRVRSIRPELGTVVVFETSERSWHGHPTPLRCPASVVRQSLALYYYEPGPPPEDRHSTIYKPELR